ncbi:hypothetical protein BpHYR1_043024, partial [Brachionus plicatilis]
VVYYVCLLSFCRFFYNPVISLKFSIKAFFSILQISKTTERKITYTFTSILNSSGKKEEINRVMYSTHLDSKPDNATLVYIKYFIYLNIQFKKKKTFPKITDLFNSFKIHFLSITRLSIEKIIKKNLELKHIRLKENPSNDVSLVLILI